MATSVLASLASFIFYASLKATLLVALVLLVQKLLGRFLSANGRYILWLAVVISLITPIGFDTTLPAFLTPGTAPEVNANVSAPITPPVVESNSALETEPQNTGITRSALNADSFPPTSYVADAPVARSVPWLNLLPYVWLMGALLVLGLVAIASYRFSVLVRGATPVAENLQKLLQGCLEQTACKARVRLLHSADIEVPMVAGLFRPALLLPAGIATRLTREQLRHVFIHELMHLQRRDIASNWVVVLVQALHWFNPAIWIAFSFMRQDRELACDAATLRHLDADAGLAYGRTLLQLSETLPRNPIPAHALGIVQSPALLRRRILMLIQASRSGKLHSAVATLLFIPLAAVAFSQPAPAVQPTEAAAPAEAAAPVEPVAALAESVASAPTPVTRETRGATPVTPQAPAADNATPVMQATPVEEARPVVQEAGVAAPAIAAAQLLALVDATTTVVDVFAPEAGEVSVVAAITAPAQPEPAAEPYDDTAAIAQLAEDINAAKSAKIAFITEWDGVAADCEARKDGLFGDMISPCQKTRKALRRGEILTFGFECYQLNTRQTALFDRYQAAAQRTGLAGAEAALRENERNLAGFCSKQTFSGSYPAFAALLEDAESLNYRVSNGRFPGTVIQGADYPGTVMSSSWIPNGSFLMSEGPGNMQPCNCEGFTASQGPSGGGEATSAPASSP